MRGCMHKKYGPRTETAEDMRLQSDMREIHNWKEQRGAYEALILLFNNPVVSTKDKEELFHLKTLAPHHLRFGASEFSCLKTDTDIEYEKNLGRYLFPHDYSRYCERQFRFDQDFLVIEKHQGCGLFREDARFPIGDLSLELEVVKNPKATGYIKEDLVIRVHYTEPTSSMDSSCL